MGIYIPVQVKGGGGGIFCYTFGSDESYQNVLSRAVLMEMLIFCISIRFTITAMERQFGRT